MRLVSLPAAHMHDGQKEVFEMYDMKNTGARGDLKQASNGFDKALIMQCSPAAHYQVQSVSSFDRKN